MSVTCSDRPRHRQSHLCQTLEQQPFTKAPGRGLAQPEELVADQPADEPAAVIVAQYTGLARAIDEIRGTPSA